MNDDVADITLAVIAGGTGSRMGCPKHMLRLAGEPILVNLLGRARWTGPTMLSIGSDEIAVVPGSEAFSQVVRDAAPDGGPLAGIVRALEACHTSAMLAVPVDMSELSHDHLAWLCRQGVARSSAAAMMQRIDSTGTRFEPFPVYLKQATLPVTKAMFDGGERALRSITSIPGFTLIDAPREWPDSVWTNLNTPDDLARAQRVRGYTEPPSSPRP